MTTSFSDAEVATFRTATPGVQHVNHLNYAGSALPTATVLATQVEHLEREATIGGYEAAGERSADNAAVYHKIAALIGASPHEIARAEHATAAWNAGFWSLPMQPGQRILTARAAYGANAVAFLRSAERRGVILEVIPDDSHGQIDLDTLATRIDDNVALVALTHIPTNGGLINPAAQVGAIANAAGVPFLLDACQSVGQRVVDVNEIGCDILSATGRKYLRGPRGSGFLYASDRIIDRLVPDHPDHHGASWVSPERYELAPDARRFEHWEYSHAAWLGLGTAVDEATAIGLDRIEVTVEARAEELRTSLADAGFAVMDLGQRRSGIVTVACDTFDGAEIKATLAAEHINISVTTPASTRFDSAARDLPNMLRLSVHYLTTADELAAAVAALRRATGR